MGILNNWLNKKDQEQLEQTAEKKVPAASSVKEKKPARAKTSRAAASHKHEHKDDVVAEKTEDKKEKKSKTVKVGLHSQSFKVLVRPLVTEKSAFAEGVGKYSFVVNTSANKNQVKAAVAEVYGVKPVKVNISNIDGRQVRFGRAMGRRSDYKKAIVTLPAGKTIDVHSGV